MYRVLIDDVDATKLTRCYLRTIDERDFDVVVKAIEQALADAALRRTNNSGGAE